MWAGIAAQMRDTGTIEVAISIHDGTYSTDYAATALELEDGNLENNAAAISEHVINNLKAFSHEHVCKFIGAGITLHLLKEVPNLCTRLWLEMDIVPIVCDIKPYVKEASATRPKIKHARSGLPSGGVSGTDTPVHVPLVGPNDNLRGVSGKIPLLRTLDEQADSAARKCLLHFGTHTSNTITTPLNHFQVPITTRVFPLVTRIMLKLAWLEEFI